MKAIIQHGSALAEVNVYRNGDRVTAVGMARYKSPHGPIDAVVNVTMSVAAFQWAREQAIKKMGSLAYTRIIGRLGIDDNIMNAPPLPAARIPQPRMLKR